MAGIDNTIIFSSGERLTESTATDIIRMQETSDSVSRINYEGDPEGVISANPSSLCHDPVSGNIYFKQTGTGNTGWVLLTGGGGSVTITADDGNSITTSPYDLFGQKAGTVPVMSTAITGGKLFMANNAFETQYVIDPSTTLGLEGTFQTIQAALDQAVIDGMTYTNPKKFILRPATYIEDLTIPGGAFFYSAGGPTDPQTSPPFVTVQGNHTLADICLWSTEGVQWITNAGTMFTAGATFLLMTSINSTFRNAGTGLILDATAGSTILTWSDSVFSTGRSDQGTVFNIASSQGVQLVNCQFNGCGFEKNQGVLRFTQCQQVGEINQTGDTNGIISFDTVHAGSSNSCVYGVGSGTFIGCSFINNDSTKYGVDLAGGCFLIGCNMYPGVSNPGDFLSPATQAATGYSYDQVGNVLKALRSATDLVNTTQANYVGITDTSAARSVVINPGPVDYQVFVCDESGGAGTNNITVTSQSGLALINGQASYVINQNYGCVLFHWDGTNWFATSGSNNVVTSNTATSAVAVGSAVSLTTATPANITSISLAAGTWVVSVLAEFGGTPTVSGPQQISVSTTSATHGTVGDNSAQSVTLTTNFTAGPVAMTIPSYILTVGSTTTVYFVASGDFSGGSLTAYGRISAFRIA